MDRGNFASEEKLPSLDVAASSETRRSGTSTCFEIGLPSYKTSAPQGFTTPHGSTDSTFWKRCSCVCSLCFAVSDPPRSPDATGGLLFVLGNLGDLKALRTFSLKMFVEVPGLTGPITSRVCVTEPIVVC